MCVCQVWVCMGVPCGVCSVTTDGVLMYVGDPLCMHRLHVVHSRYYVCTINKARYSNCDYIIRKITRLHCTWCHT